MTANHKQSRQLLPILLGMAVAFLIIAKPAGAHAGFLDVASVAYDAVLDIILSALVTVNSLLALLLDASGRALTWVLSLQITTQLTVIGIAWTAIRDMCNLVFIIVFIGIAFGTIFNATGMFKSWHYSSALMPLLVAAVLMNFSLAIGKTMVLVSNEAVKSVLSVLTNPGGRLVDILKPNTLAISSIDLNARAALSAPITDARKTYTDAENKRFQECIKEERPGGTFVQRWIFNQPEGTEYKGAGDCNLEILAARSGTTTQAIAQAGQQVAAGGATIPSGTIEQKVMYIGDALFKVLMILLLTSCLVSAFVFLALRILMVWVLLATAALAWASYAIPGDKAIWKLWWKHMVAWNVFGPLYLLSLIPGLVMLGGSGQMLAQLQLSGGAIGTAGLYTQQLLFYVFAAMVFIGGLALSLKSSFALHIGGKEGGIVGGWARKLGIFDERGMAPLRVAGRTTGVTSYGGVAIERAQQAKQDVTAAARRRFPELLRTEEEARALAKSRLGVRGGAEEFAKAISGRIKAERERVEAPLKQQVQLMENRLSQARTPVEREDLQKQLKDLKERNSQQLKSLLQSGNRDTALAAGEVLLEDDKISADELRNLGQRYSQISPAAMSEFVKRRNEKLIKNVPKRKFADAAELESYLTLIGDPKDAKKYYDAAKTGKNKLMVLEAGINMGMEIKPDGKSRYTFDDLAPRAAKKFTNDDWLAADEFFAAREEQRAKKENRKVSSLGATNEMKSVGNDQQLFKEFALRLSNRDARAAITAGARDGAQAVRIGRATLYADANKKVFKQQAADARIFTNETEVKPGDEAKGDKAQKEPAEEKPAAEKK